MNNISVLVYCLSFACFQYKHHAGGGLIPANARSSAMGNVGVMFADHYSLLPRWYGIGIIILWQEL